MGFLIFCAHTFEVTFIGTLLLLVKTLRVNLKPARSGLKFILGLWGMYVFGLFVAAQLVIYGKSSTYTERILPHDSS